MGCAAVIHRNHVQNEKVHPAPTNDVEICTASASKDSSHARNAVPSTNEKPVVGIDDEICARQEDKIRALEAELEKLRRAVVVDSKHSAQEVQQVEAGLPIEAQGGSCSSEAPNTDQISSMTKGSKLQWTVCLGEELGEGTSGKVCEVEQNPLLDMGGSYAIKLVECKGAEEQKLRFTEAKLHGLLGAHPSLVRYSYSWFVQDNDMLCVLMERCQEDLWAYITEKPADWTLPTHVKATWSVQLAEGLHYIRKHNVMHRDLSPWNIFTKYDESTMEETILKIGDFGLSVQIKPTTRLPLTGIEPPPDHIAMPLDESAMGSLYSAPELGQSYDFTVDLYSLGMTLFFIWDSPRNLDDLITRIEVVKDTAKIPDDFQGPEGLSQLLQRLLSHDPAQRGSSLEVLRNLQKLEENVLVEDALQSPTCINRSIQGFPSNDRINTLQ